MQVSCIHSDEGPGGARRGARPLLCAARPRPPRSRRAGRARRRRRRRSDRRLRAGLGLAEPRRQPRGPGAHASTTVLRSGGSPKLLIVSHALVARDGAHASAAKRALGAVSPARANGVDARALGVSAAALRKAQRIAWRDGPVVGQLVVVGAAKDDALVRPPPGRCAHPCAPHPRPVGVGRAARPCCRPRRPRRRVDGRSGLLAGRRPAARRARAEGPEGLDPGGHARHQLGPRQLRPPHAGRAPGLRQGRAARFRPLARGPAAGAQLNAVKDQAIAFVGQRAGVQLTLPITIVRGYPSTARGAAAWASMRAAVIAPTKPAARCIISVRSGGVSKTVIAHEVFHCLQIQLTGRANGLQALDADRAWLGEGSASYAGCLFSQDGAAPYRKAYAAYVEQPLTPLGQSHLRRRRLLRPLGCERRRRPRRRAAGDRVVVAGGGSLPGVRRGRPGHLRRVGLEPLPQSRRSAPQWDVSGPCVPPRSAAAQPTPIVLTAGGRSRSLLPPTPRIPTALRRPLDCRRDPGARRERPRAVGAAGVDAQPTGDAVYCLGSGRVEGQPPIALTGGLTGAKVTMTAVDASVACGPGGARDVRRPAVPAVQRPVIDPAAARTAVARPARQPDPGRERQARYADQRLGHCPVVVP